jgi:hypothetical protein
VGGEPVKVGLAVHVLGQAADNDNDVFGQRQELLEHEIDHAAQVHLRPRRIQIKNQMRRESGAGEELRTSVDWKSMVVAKKRSVASVLVNVWP